MKRFKLLTSGHAESLTKPPATSLNFRHQLDFKTASQRELRHADRASRVSSLFTKNFLKQFRSSVSDEMMLRKARGRIDQAQQLHNSLNLVQISERVMHGC